MPAGVSTDSALEEISPGIGTYLNFAGFWEEGEELLRASYVRNYERLQVIKLKYDPGNIFRGSMNIAPMHRAKSA
jgi:FAD/FMN-containing dehydrogenase